MSNKNNDYDVVLYHGSPINNIKKLRANSYVSLFPHIAYIMGLYHTKTNKTWKDDDLKEPYDFGKKIHFKKNNKPDGVPILYKLKTKWTNIIIQNNFPYEMILKNETDVKIINNKKIIYDKIKNSEKLFDYYYKIGLDIQHGSGEFIINIKQPWFNLITAKKKIVEGRLNKGFFANLKINDTIIFTHKKLKTKMIIKSINKYNNFKEMIEEEGLSNVMPGIKSIDEAVGLYRQYYTQDDEKKYGVLAINLKEQHNNIHESKLQSPYYEFIRDGIKIYETRVYDDKRKKMKIDDTWIFSHNTDQTKPPIKTKIVGIKIYKSFREAIEDTGVKQLLPQIDDIEDGIKIYEGFDNGNYKIDGEKYGVVRFELKVLFN